MKRFVVMLSIWIALATQALATQQVNDKIATGSNTYGIYQLPMASYWYNTDEEPKGRVPLPEFEFTSSANWRCYTAKWIISRGKLSLLKVAGQIDGKKVTNEQVLKKTFPVPARWYTGKIFVSIGDFDSETNKHGYVIEFAIERGNVVATKFHESAEIPMTRDGLPEKQREKVE